MILEEDIIAPCRLSITKGEVTIWTLGCEVPLTNASVESVEMESDFSVNPARRVDM